MLLKNIESLKKFIESNSENIIISTNGCFDILHRGHIEYLNQAKKLGDILIVGLNSDNSVKRLKGDTRPIVFQEDRAYVIDNLKMVDAVYIFDEDTPIEFLKIVKPNLHVKGGDYSKELPETKIVEANGGKIKFLRFVENKSTTSIIEKIEKNLKAEKEV